MKFTVLMSVYKKEKAEYLKLALESVINQTLKPDEIVLVQDGVLTEELYGVVEKYHQKYPTIFKTYALKENQGLGKALNFGIDKCSNELIARMDTDDIAEPNRFELQTQEFIKNKERYCLWLLGANPGEVRACHYIMDRIECVRKFRAESRRSPKVSTFCRKLQKNKGPRSASHCC